MDMGKTRRRSRHTHTVVRVSMKMVELSFGSHFFRHFCHVGHGSKPDMRKTRRLSRHAHGRQGFDENGQNLRSSDPCDLDL